MNEDFDIREEQISKIIRDLNKIDLTALQDVN